MSYTYKLTFQDGSTYLMHRGTDEYFEDGKEANYLVTFDDGTELYLEHFGVKGMKWGVRKAETVARYARNKVKDFAYDVSEVMGGGGGGMDWEEENEEEEKDNPDLWKKQNKQRPAEWDMYEVNPLFNEGFNHYMDRALKRKTGFSLTTKEYALINCADCSMVYDLRRRGYDVSANATDNVMDLGYRIGDYYKDAKMVPTERDKALNNIERYPNGSRGVFAGRVKNGGGHAIAWEKKNGEVSYYDCQTSTKYSSEGIKNVFDETKPSYEVRLDNKTPNLRRMRSDGLVTSMNKTKKARLDAEDHKEPSKKKIFYKSEQQHLKDYVKQLKGKKPIKRRKKMRQAAKLKQSLDALLASI